MPGFDGTGPRGMGPMTGGGRGFCSPWGVRATLRAGVVPPYPWTPYPFYGSPGAMPFYGGYAPGTPPGQHQAAPETNPFPSQMSPDQELDFLKNQAEAIKDQLEQIEARMRDLEAKE